MNKLVRFDWSTVAGPILRRVFSQADGGTHQRTIINTSIGRYRRRRRRAGIDLHAASF